MLGVFVGWLCHVIPCWREAEIWRLPLPNIKGRVCCSSNLACSMSTCRGTSTPFAAVQATHNGIRKCHNTGPSAKCPPTKPLLANHQLPWAHKFW